MIKQINATQIDVPVHSTQKAVQVRIFESAVNMEVIKRKFLRKGSANNSMATFQNMRCVGQDQGAQAPNTRPLNMLERTAAVALKVRAMRENKRRLNALVELLKYIQALLSRNLSAVERQALQKLTDWEIRSLMLGADSPDAKGGSPMLVSCSPP